MPENVHQNEKINNQSFFALQFIAKNQNIFPAETIPTLLVIAAHLPNSHPQIELISEISGRSKSSVIRDIKKLESIGVVSVEKMHRQANFYRLNLVDKSEKSEILGVTAMAPKKESWVSKRESLGVTAMKPQDTNKKKYKNINTNKKNYNKKNTSNFFDFLSNAEFLNLIQLHPKKNAATQCELEALYRSLANPGDILKPSEDEGQSTE